MIRFGSKGDITISLDLRGQPFLINTNWYVPSWVTERTGVETPISVPFLYHEKVSPVRSVPVFIVIGSDGPQLTVPELLMVRVSFTSKFDEGDGFMQFQEIMKLL